ncbi:SDR family oxidoreductase [Leucobacter chromiireducens]|uniref:SDR family oxidoreductase n=1 Tax=Leucobacter chromiireducens TaxID=283877 RepID=UPI003F7DCB70
MCCSGTALRRLALPARTDGSILLLGSAATAAGSPGTYVHYAAMKAAVATLAIGLSTELAHSGVRVNCVEHGTIWTESPQNPDRPAKVSAVIPMGRTRQRMTSRAPSPGSFRQMRRTPLALFSEWRVEWSALPLRTLHNHSGVRRGFLASSYRFRASCAIRTSGSCTAPVKQNLAVLPTCSRCSRHRGTQLWMPTVHVPRSRRLPEQSHQRAA